MANEFVARNGVIALDDSQITGSLIVTNGITGSLFGTSSFATNALTASYADNVPATASFAVTASYAISASQAINSDNALTASYVQTAQTASYVLNAISASFASNANNATTASYVLNAVSASFATQALSASFASNADNATTASYVQTAQTASYVLNAISASQATNANNATTASYVQTAQTASYVLNAVSASYATQALSASFASNASTATSASYAATSSYASTFNVAGTLTAQTLNVQTVSSSVVYSSGSNIFGNQLSNTQQFTGSLQVTGSTHYILGNVCIGTTVTSTEGNLSLGALGALEGGQLILQRGTSQASASMLDNFTNQFRILTGTDTVSNREDLNLSHVTRNLTIYGDVVAFGSSDKRLKDNIQPIENALEKLDKIGGYTFDWNDQVDVHGHEGGDIGVIAQEIEEVLPETVTTRDNGYKAVKYEKLVAFLIQVDKEQQEIIKDQQRQIDELRELINIYIKTQ